MKWAFHSRLRCSVAVALAFLPLWAGAALLVPGSPAPLMALEDQHGKPIAVGAATQIIVFAADKKASDFVNQVLAAQNPAVLDRLQAVYVADISAMPGVITRMFALPKLRELPFAIGLVREAVQAADLPRQVGAATVLRLQGGKVNTVEYAKNADQLRSMLGLEPSQEAGTL